MQLSQNLCLTTQYRNHDRLLIIDDKAYLLGASMKDIGAGLCAVTELSTSAKTILEMLK